MADASATRREQPQKNEPPGWGAAFMSVGKSAFAGPITFFAEVGIMARLSYETLMWGIRPPYRFRLFVSAFEFIGVQSIFIVGLTGMFVGAVFGLQLVDGFRQFGAESQTGAAATSSSNPSMTAQDGGLLQQAMAQQMQIQNETSAASTCGQ